MRYLYYCNSAYQVLTILNLHWHRKHANFENIENYEADIILLNASDDMKELANNIIDLNEYNNVFLAKKIKNKGLFHRIKSIYGIVNPYWYIRKSGISGKNIICDYYDVLTCPKFSKLTASFYRVNENATLDLFEDGLGSYNDCVLLEHSRLIYKCLYKIFGYKEFKYFRYIYFNMPQIYNGKYKEKSKYIPKFDSKYINEINKVVSIDNKYENKKIIWLGQYINDDINYVIDDVLTEYKDISIYKPHPRYSLISKNLEKVEDKQPWEISILNIDDINKKCFVTIHSTSAFSPKMLYSYEPYVIFTYKLLKKELSEKTELAIDNFASSYQNKEKIMIPNTIEELKENIELYIAKEINH